MCNIPKSSPTISIRLPSPLRKGDSRKCRIKYNKKRKFKYIHFPFIHPPIHLSFFTFILQIPFTQVTLIGQRTKLLRNGKYEHQSWCFFARVHVFLFLPSIMLLAYFSLFLNSCMFENSYFPYLAFLVEEIFKFRIRLKLKLLTLNIYCRIFVIAFM
jgi:hypothetical protein